METTQKEKLGAKAAGSPDLCAVPSPPIAPLGLSLMGFAMCSPAAQNVALVIAKVSQERNQRDKQKAT